MKNILSIDYGTSTTVLRTKAYQDTDADHALECGSVVFGQDRSTTVPTVIRESEKATSYGFDALMGKGTLRTNFKLMLRSADEAERNEGIRLTRMFFEYLYAQFKDQKKYLFTNTESPEETVVSYPAQWNQEQKDIVLQAAKDAGFQHVKGVNEAEASVRCVLNAKQEELRKAKLLVQGKKLPILVLDMGAGTTDLAFVEVTLDQEVRCRLKGTWPEWGSKELYGGSQMDTRLQNILADWLEGSGFTKGKNMVTAQAPGIKQWKEQTVSVVLGTNQSIDDCAVISAVVEPMCDMMGLELLPFPTMNRSCFERLFSQELQAFVNVIHNAPKDLLGETELVILTGGNSAWYWIEDILRGKDTRFGTVSMPNLKDILSMELPNETVARGAVYQGFPTLISPAEERPAYTDPFGVGKIVTMGSYGGERVEWLVLAANGNTRTMITLKGQDYIRFNKKPHDGNRWETSHIRRWLNNVYYNAAFSDEEKAMITAGPTGDQVWLLSVEEAEQYFASDTARLCHVTHYSYMNGSRELYIDDSKTLSGCYWWLRSPTRNEQMAHYVTFKGKTDDFGLVHLDRTVRPAVVVSVGCRTHR